jgi:hypothetical protein
MKANHKLKNHRSQQSSFSLATPINPTDQKSLPQHTLPPDDQTILRLNMLAKQYPFCIWFRHNSHSHL